jgi:hypothetical protein
MRNRYKRNCKEYTYRAEGALNMACTQSGWHPLALIPRIHRRQLAIHEPPRCRMRREGIGGVSANRIIIRASRVALMRSSISLTTLPSLR